MKALKYFAFFTAAFFLLACNQTPAEEAHQENNYKYEGMTVEDEIDVLTDYAANTMLSIQLADVAAQSASTEKVREFAIKVNQDHRQMITELTALAANFNMTLPAQLSEGQREMVADLREKEGNELDKAYLDSVIEYHEAFKSKMEEIIQETEYPQMMDFARMVDSHHYVHYNQAKNMMMELDA